MPFKFSKRIHRNCNELWVYQGFLVKLHSQPAKNYAKSRKVSVTGMLSMDRSVANSTRLALGTGAVPIVHRVAMAHNTMMSPGVKEMPCIRAMHTWAGWEMMGKPCKSADPSKGEGAREAGILRIWAVPCGSQSHFLPYLPYLNAFLRWRLASWLWGSLFRRIWGVSQPLGAHSLTFFLIFPILMHSLGDVWHPGSGVPCFGGFGGFRSLWGLTVSLSSLSSLS